MKKCRYTYSSSIDNTQQPPDHNCFISLLVELNNKLLPSDKPRHLMSHALRIYMQSAAFSDNFTKYRLLGYGYRPNALIIFPTLNIICYELVQLIYNRLRTTGSTQKLWLTVWVVLDSRRELFRWVTATETAFQLSVTNTVVSMICFFMQFASFGLFLNFFELKYDHRESVRLTLYWPNIFSLYFVNFKLSLIDGLLACIIFNFFRSFRLGVTIFW